MTQKAKMITGVGIGAALALAGIGALLSNSPAQAGGAAGAASGADAVVTVYRSPTCGCCKDWEDHLREAGFTVESIETPAVDIVKVENGVPRPLQSCHTALVDGYVVEGHVPADEIARMLRDRPDVRGLAVPGMPAGSPGMEVPGRPAQPYEVFAFSGDGSAEVWATR
jgi:hypothetical protein